MGGGNDPDLARIVFRIPDRRMRNAHISLPTFSSFHRLFSIGIYIITPHLGALMYLPLYPS